MEISLKHDKEKGKIIVVSPYNASFVNKCRNLRGSFKSGAWHFDDSIEEYVKQAMIDTYGVDGTTEVLLCSLIVKDFSGHQSCGPVELFGRTIAKAFGRDSGAKLGDGIIMIDGDCGSGGSVKNWSTYVRNAHFIIKKFPLERTKFTDVQNAISEGWVEIKIEEKKQSKEEIETQISSYRSKIEELELQLAEL